MLNHCLAGALTREVILGWQSQSEACRHPEVVIRQRMIPRYWVCVEPHSRKLTSHAGEACYSNWVALRVLKKTCSTVVFNLSSQQPLQSTTCTHHTMWVFQERHQQMPSHQPPSTAQARDNSPSAR